jgi:hypothetical protein
MTRRLYRLSVLRSAFISTGAQMMLQLNKRAQSFEVERKRAQRRTRAWDRMNFFSWL